MAWWVPIAAAVAGSLANKAFGGDDAEEATRQETQETTNEPWSGLQPYLTGGGLLPSYLSSMPDIYRPWLEWAQGSGTGANLSAPPPMMFDYVRAQEGIGTGGGDIGSPIYGNPASESQRVSVNPFGDDAAGQQRGLLNQSPTLYFGPQGEAYADMSAALRARRSDPYGPAARYTLMGKRSPFGGLLSGPGWMGETD